MEEESVLDIAIAWTLLGMIFSVYILVKMGTFENRKDLNLVLEPRVMSDWEDYEYTKNHPK